MTDADIVPVEHFAHVVQQIQSCMAARCGQWQRTFGNPTVAREMIMAKNKTIVTIIDERVARERRAMMNAVEPLDRTSADRSRESSRSAFSTDTAESSEYSTSAAVSTPKRRKFAVAKLPMSAQVETRRFP